MKRTRLPARVMARVASLPPSAWGLVLAVMAGVAADEAWARPGGGHSYSGGGGSSSGGGGGGGDVDIVALYYLIRLCIEYPPLGIAVLIGAGIFYYVKHRHEGGDWTAGTVDPSTIDYPAPGSHRSPRRETSPARSPRRELLALTKTDPDFSIVVFEDFVYALFARVQDARGKGEIPLLAPYLRPGVRDELIQSSRAVQAVETVVIGAMTYLGATVPRGGEGEATVRLQFEANYTETATGGAPRTYYVVEQWTLSRPMSARSKPPEEAAAVGCPNCGAPLSNMRGEVCGYCDTYVGSGEFGWQVDNIRLLNREARGPQLTGTVAEAGTSLPTVRDPDVVGELAQLRQRDPAFSMDALDARVHLIFTGMNEAWSARDWAKARPYVSDGLFKTILYWIEAYQKAGLRNIQADASIKDVEVARITTDRYFTALTLRLRASAKDYTEDDRGRVVGGSKRIPRQYTEYWTLIRSKASTGTIVTSPQCPSCGAPLDISMAGNCNHCQAKVTSGAFDWVLSRIEQDESYQP